MKTSKFKAFRQAFILSKNSCLALTQVFLILVTLNLVMINGQNISSIWIVDEGQIINGIVQNDKTYSHYSLIVTPDNYDGISMMSIRVIQEQFNSDPDIFISLSNQFPNSSLNSDYFCTSEGSDSCLIPASSLSFGTIIYVGVRCIEACQYTFANNYLTPRPVQSANTTTFVLDSYSSNLFSFVIPSTNYNGNTKAVIFQFSSDSAYNPIDAYFSFNSQVYQQNQRQIQDVTATGVAIYFTSDDFGWCTNCQVYLLLDVIVGSKYYVTATPTNRNVQLQSSIPYNMIVNANQQECSQYYISGQSNDLLVTSIQQEGDSDLYISNGNIPANIQDSKVKAVAQIGAQKTLIFSAADRNQTSFRTGLAQICLYGRQDSSALITANEFAYNSKYEASNNMIFSFNLPSKGSSYFTYTQSDLAFNGTFVIQVGAYNLNSTQQPPRIFYQVCSQNSAANCLLSSQDQIGNTTAVTEIGQGQGNVTNGNIRTAVLRHYPGLCPDSSSCIYVFSVYYNYTGAAMPTSFMANFSTNNSGIVSISNAYKDIIQQGTYFYYQLAPGITKGLSQLVALTIKVQSLIGDADIVVSVKDKKPTFNTGNFESISTGKFETITLNTTANFTINQTIVIGVYGYTTSTYELVFEPIYNGDYNLKLDKAVVMLDSIPQYNYFIQEYQESFYSFTPWWSGFEQRTIVIFGDVIFNNIFFYMVPNDFPLFYLTEYQDQDDIMALPYTDPDYSIYNTYYIRVRPQFQLQDLISKQQYIFNFFVFSQHMQSTFLDIALNTVILGYANQSSTYYRHYVLDNTGTYNISVIPIIGNPSLLLKLSDNVIYPTSHDVQSWDFKQNNQETPNATESIIVSFAVRSGLYNSCLNAGYNLNGGNKSCGYYIAVECLDSACIYNISITIIGRQNQNLPNYITDKMYVNGAVHYANYSYFYFPLSQNNTGDMILILNKTGSSQVNGDSMLLALILSQTATLTVDKWSYPSTRNYTIASTNSHNDQPEIIEICSKIISSLCSNSSCVLMVGILGLSPNKTSNFRLLVQSQKNKLYERQAVNGVILNPGDYQYYWFVCNMSVTNASAIWSYEVSLGVSQDGQDADVFVSVLDGRFPIDTDFDYSSTMLGPDNLMITSSDKFWTQNGYNKSNGVIFVVGVKGITPNVSYTLLMQGPVKLVYYPSNLTVGVQMSRGLNYQQPNNRTNYYKWFNWGFQDFRIDISCLVGAINVYVNFVGEETFAANGYTNFPISANSSTWTVQLNATQAGLLKVSKYNVGGTGLFCYYCWYFITIDSNSTGINSYLLTVNNVPDIGLETPILNTNQMYQLVLPATGSVTQRKFILDSTQTFSIQSLVTQGSLVMYVSLYPDNAISQYQWTTSGTGVLSLTIKQTDQKFHLGAYYYITCQSSSGRTSFTLQVTQNRVVKPLYPGDIQKVQYSSMQERVKNYFFQAPAVKGLFKATFNIIPLQPGFYPIVLLNSFNLTSTPSNFLALSYPNIVNYTQIFGDNFFSVANQSQFSFVFRDYGTNYTFYTMSLYSFSYGMTDQRKPAFKIQLIIDTKNLNAPMGQLAYSEVLTSQVDQQQKDYQLTTAWLARKASFLE